MHKQNNPSKDGISSSLPTVRIFIGQAFPANTRYPPFNFQFLAKVCRLILCENRALAKHPGIEYPVCCNQLQKWSYIRLFYTHVNQHPSDSMTVQSAVYEKSVINERGQSLSKKTLNPGLPCTFHYKICVGLQHTQCQTLSWF